MIELGQHAGFIVWAYAGALLTIAALALHTVLASRAATRALRQIEGDGARPEA